MKSPARIITKDALASKLRVVLGDVTVARPVKMGQIQLLGLDISILKEEIRLAVSSTGGCSPNLSKSELVL